MKKNNSQLSTSSLQQKNNHVMPNLFRHLSSRCPKASTLEILNKRKILNSLRSFNFPAFQHDVTINKLNTKNNFPLSTFHFPLAKSALLDFAPLGQKFPAFSLAEVLTTLMLIGVVAAILVPALYININNQKNVAALKRMYSDFSINIQTVLNYYNCSSISCTRKYGKIGAQRTPDGKYIGPHNGVFADPTIIKLARECPECFVKNSIMPVDMITIKDTFENRAGVRTPVVLPANFTAYQFETGSAMGLFDYPGNCVHTGGVTYTGGRIWRCPPGGMACYWDIANNDPVPICGIVVFDTNGAKAPNLPGKDRFAYYIMDEPLDDSYLVPVGYSFDDDNPRNKSKFNKNGFIRSEMAGNKCIPNDKSGQGYNCTAKVMLNNWKINY